MANFDERFDFNDESKDNIIYDEHLIRYKLAKQLVENKNVLDIACGSGYGSEIMAQNKAQNVIAVDIDSETIAKNKQKNKQKNLQYQTGNAEKIEFKDETFDIITSFETIEHLKNPSRYLQELSRVIKKDGIVLISTPNKEIYKEKNPYHHREYTKEEFKNLLSDYFPNIKIITQSNALISFISKNGQTIEASSPQEKEALYFIAICSHAKEKIEKFDFQPIGSINPQALERINNNPGWKLINKTYSLIIKIPGIKGFLSSRTKR